jgi:hypothetical protein
MGMTSFDRSSLSYLQAGRVDAPVTPSTNPSHGNVISRAKDGLAQAFRVSTAAPVLA